MFHNKLPPIERLRELFNYDPQTGILTFAMDIRNYHRKFDRKIGDIAGYLVKNRLVAIIDGQGVYLHRVIWMLMTGRDPGEYEIDHINRISTDNRWDNLRLADRSLNCCNTEQRKDNASGQRGVHFDSKHKSKPWVVQININGSRVCKRFSQKEKAIEKAQELITTRNGSFD